MLDCGLRSFVLSRLVIEAIGSVLFIVGVTGSILFVLHLPLNLLLSYFIPDTGGLQVKSSIHFRYAWEIPSHSEQLLKLLLPIDIPPSRSGHRLLPLWCWNLFRSIGDTLINFDLLSEWCHALRWQLWHWKVLLVFIFELTLSKVNWTLLGSHCHPLLQRETA